jgi:hypothetical protein
MVPNQNFLAHALLTFTLVLGGCAPAIQEAPVVPPAEAAGVQVQVWRHTRTTERAQDVYIKNYTDRPIHVTLLQLYNCVNVQQECTGTTPNVIVAPGAVALVTTVRPALSSRPFSFGYNYQWREGTPNMSTPR